MTQKVQLGNGFMESELNFFWALRLKKDSELE
jgi:hypothetical protein